MFGGEKFPSTPCLGKTIASLSKKDGDANSILEFNSRKCANFWWIERVGISPTKFEVARPYFLNENDILNIFPYLIIKRKIGDVNGTWTLEYCGVEPSYITIRTYGKPIIFFFLFVIIVISTVNKNKKKNFCFFRESTFIAVTFSRAG